MSTGPEDPCCSCSWSTRGSTPFALFPPTPEGMSSSSPVESSQPVCRKLLLQSSDTCLVKPSDVILPLTTRYVNEFGRGNVFRSCPRTQVVLVLSHTRGGTSAAPVLRRSDARAVVHRPTNPDLLRLQRKRRCRSCCLVFLCSSASTQDVTFGMISPHMTMGYCSSTIQRDDALMIWPLVETDMTVSDVPRWLTELCKYLSCFSVQKLLLVVARTYALCILGTVLMMWSRTQFCLS